MRGIDISTGRDRRVDISTGRLSRTVVSRGSVMNPEKVKSILSVIYTSRNYTSPTVLGSVGVNGFATTKNTSKMQPKKTNYRRH